MWRWTNRPIGLFVVCRAGPAGVGGGGGGVPVITPPFVDGGRGTILAVGAFSEPVRSAAGCHFRDRSSGLHRVSARRGGTVFPPPPTRVPMVVVVVVGLMDPGIVRMSFLPPPHLTPAGVAGAAGASITLITWPW